MTNPFVVPFEQLPGTLPVFPLPGTIVMPGGELPLNIFEPRYLNMVDDALATRRMIGMIQPDPEAGEETVLCPTGCAGRITRYRETGDGRIEMVLSGVCRFDIGEELPSTRGYRRVVPDWSRFRADYAAPAPGLHGQHADLLQTLRRYLAHNNLETDWPMLERLPTPDLLNNLCMALPLGVQDKQRLLETVDPAPRLSLLIAMLEGELAAPASVTRH